LVFGDIRIAADHAALDRDGASNCIDHAGKFDQGTIACRLDDPATVRGDC
jgi:hypothetical protein